MSHDELERSDVIGAAVAVVEAVAAGVMFGIAWSATSAFTTGATVGVAVIMLALALQILDSVACSASVSWRCRECGPVGSSWKPADPDAVEFADVEDAHPDAGGDLA